MATTPAGWNKTGNVRGPRGPGPTPEQVQAAAAQYIGQNAAQFTGPRGSRWYTGSGAPGTIADSLPGDMYLDTDSGDVYQLGA